MAPSAPAKPEINTNPTQPGRARPARRSPGKASTADRGRPRVSGEARESARGSARVVVEVGWGVLVYPPEGAVGVWRATFTENGRRRFRQAVTEAELAVKLEKVTERLAAGAPGLEAPPPICLLPEACKRTSAARRSL